MARICQAPVTLVLVSDHLHPHHSPEHWDERYAGSEQVWSGDPNQVLVAVVSGESPGTVLDVGCGEGADALWLGQQGWRVTAIDVSAVAVGRARAAADAAGVAVTWVVGDLLEERLGSFDLVSVFYAPFVKDAGAEAALLESVAPGGSLLCVHHADIDRAEALSHGFDPDDFVSRADVLAAVRDAGWTIELDETRERSVASGAGANHRLDWVVRARRP